MLKFVLVRSVMLMLLALVLAPGHAVPVPGLYEASVPVSSQGPGERERALRVGLSQVLERVTGQVGAELSESVREVISNASTALQQYRYDVVRDGPLAGQIRLWMLFDPANVERLLSEQGVPAWGDERPETLMWVAVDDGRRRLLSSDALGELRDAVDAASVRNGLPLILPLMDLEDRSRIGFSEVWGDFRERIMDASQRYAARSVLLGRLTRSGSGWQARWTHILPDGESQTSEFASNSVAVMNSGVSLALRRLAERFASTGLASGVESATLSVTGVGSLEDYGAVTRYLSRMPLVKDWFMRQVDGEKLIFDLQLKGGKAAFARAVTLDAVLVENSFRDPASNTLVYRFAQ